MTWWRDGVLYQIYVRSFADSNGDGTGDLRGVIERIDHLAWLGVDGIWLSPVHPSPDEDWGYDVADYRSVHRALGSLDDLDALVAAAGTRGIRVVLDLVPNHTSDRHPWFVGARASRSSHHRGRYVWADPAPGGGPPNNWLSSFGGAAWTFEETTGQFYLHNFLPSQPDLDWWNEEVRREFDAILRFWFDRGIAGFRIDVCHMLVKDAALRDNPPAGDDDPPFLRFLGQRQTYNSDQAEVHDVLRRWRRIADAYDPSRLLLGEVYLFDPNRIVAYHGRGDELDLAFNFPFLFSRFDAESLGAIIAATERALPAHASPVWTASNHDAGRFAKRWCESDERRIRCALVILFGLRGTTVLYYGDEIGMPEVPVPFDDLRDPVGRRFWPASPGRDPARTPMQWSAAANGGFTTADARPWLPIGDSARCNVESQKRDPGSILHLCRNLIALRRASQDLSGGAWAAVPAPAGVLAWRRGRRTAVAANLQEGSVTMPIAPGILRLSTAAARTGERVGRQIDLGPWEAVVVETAEESSP